MTIKDIFQKFLGKDKEMAKAEKEEHIRTIIEKKRKTPNERELEFRLEKKRQQMINEQLRQMKDEERKDMLKSPLMNKENMFRGQGNDMLKQETIFKGGSMFFT
jgi:hypothetical protein